MKPEIPITRDSLMVKKMRIETPMGSLESDSGSHFVDIVSVVGVIVVLYAGKKIFNRIFKRAK